MAPTADVRAVAEHLAEAVAHLDTLADAMAEYATVAAAWSAEMEAASDAVADTVRTWREALVAQANVVHRAVAALDR